MASGESLLETGVRLKTVKPKKVLTNLWSIGRRTIWVGFTRRKPKLATQARQTGIDGRIGKKGISSRRLTVQDTGCVELFGSNHIGPERGIRK
jgi:hypothetical protein